MGVSSEFELGAMIFGLEVNMLFVILYAFKSLVIKRDVLVLEIPIQFQLLFLCALVVVLDPPWSSTTRKRLSARCVETFTFSVCLLIILFAYSGSIPRGTFAFLCVGPLLSVVLTHLLAGG